jgi:hypothetical protein
MAIYRGAGGSGDAVADTSNASVTAVAAAAAAEASAAAAAANVDAEFALITATASTLSEGSPATSAFNTTTKVLSLGIPTGPTGATGATGPAGPTGPAGAGLDNFTDTLNDTAPNDSVNVAALSVVGTATDIDVAIVPIGDGSILASIPDNTATGGNKRGTHTVDLQTLRNAATQVAAGNYAVVSGGRYNTALGTYSVVSGGNGNAASGNWSVVAGGDTNTASYQAAILGGYNNVASGDYSAIVGGEGHIASAQYSFIGGGSSNTASGYLSYVSSGYSNNASATQSAISNSQYSLVEGDYSTIGGGYSNTIDITGYVAVISGGENNTASGFHSFIGGGYANTASDDFSTIAGGESNTAGYEAAILGGYANAATGDYSAILGGSNNTASGNWSAVASGTYNIASGDYSIASGSFADTRGLYGANVWASSASFGINGVAQVGNYIAISETTNATATVLTFDQAAAGTTNQLVLPNDSTYFFTISISARRTNADNESAAYKFEGCIDRNTNAASTALVGVPVKTILAEDTTAWDVSVTADTTNGALAITVTGEASKTIRWVAHIQTVEVVG